VAELTLEARLVAMGESLAFPRAESLVDDVLGALESPAERAPTRWWRPVLAVAAAVLLIVAVTLAVPESRRAVARWLGFDGYRIDRVVELPDVGAAPAPADTVIVRGDLEQMTFGKLVEAGTNVDVVAVNGRTAYWISGDQHLFFMYHRDGSLREQRLAGNTLVWQDGDEIVRIEGVGLTLEQALALARGEGTSEAVPG
jgi:hypothetical protein